MTVYPRPPRKYLDFGKLMSDTWRLAWRHKFLWFFGLFAGGSTALGGWNGSINFGGGATDDTGNASSNASHAVSDWVNAHFDLLLLLAGIIILVVILVWLWSIVCRGAVIGSVRDIGEEKDVNFGTAFRRGRESFGRLLLFDLLLVLLALGFGVIVLGIGLIIFALAGMLGTVGKVILLILSLWIFTFVGFGMGFLFICTIWFVPWVFLGILILYAMRAVVLERARPVAALARGGRVMMENLTQALFTFLVSVGLGIAAIILMVMAGGASSIPAAVAWIIAYDRGWPIAITAIAAVLLVLPVAVVLTGIALMNTYFTSFWTIAYDKLAGKEPADISYQRAPNPVPRVQPPPQSG